ncbi:nuclear transport factor 2 family protein [Rhypophila sp. PSN 637]
MARGDSSATVTLLKYLYQDLSRISEVSSSDILLHPADRDLCTPPREPLRGIDAAQAHEDALIAATGGALVMDVQSIDGNEHFGVVLGVLRATRSGREELAIPFCGVWRFQHGKAVEHWENAADPKVLKKWLEI